MPDFAFLVDCTALRYNANNSNSNNPICNLKQKDFKLCQDFDG